MLKPSTPHWQQSSQSCRPSPPPLCVRQDPAGQLAQLVAAEHLLGVALPGRVREAPLLLKALYDEDLAEEELIVAWCVLRRLVRVTWG